MVNFFNIDCVSFMKSKPDKCYDLAIIDIPYGLGDKLTRNGGRISIKREMLIGMCCPKQEYFDQLFRVSKIKLFGVEIM